MVDAIVSVVLERIAALVEEKIRDEVNLMRGFKKEIRKLSVDLNTVRNVLDDAEKKGCTDTLVKGWLTRLEDTSYEMDDVLDEWNYSLLKFQIEQSSHDHDVVGDNVVVPKKKVWFSFIPSPCLCFKKVISRHEIALKIRQVKEQLDLILSEKDQYGFAIASQPSGPSHSESGQVQSTSIIGLEEVCGRDLERENLVRELVGEGGIGGKGLRIHVISIVGTGGIGKTALARLTYNDSQVENCFDLKIWICVSRSFDVVGIANGIIEGAGGSKPDNTQLDMTLKCLKETISEKKFLLVLDDVWTEDDAKWEPLRNCLSFCGVGSKILMTTRNESVAIMMDTDKNSIHQLGQLSNEHCWLLLSRIALSRKEEEERQMFQTIGKSIADKCQGSPLAAKTLGSLLRIKNSLEDWNDVLNSELWELGVVELKLFPHLYLSYNELSPTQKRCFSYCAVFPKGTEIDVESLITKWMAMGYLGFSGGNASDWKRRGRECFDKLATRSLFQDFERDLGLGLGDQKIIRSFKMHDILHDFAQFLRKKSRSTEDEICQTCGPLIVSNVKEYHSLFNYGELPGRHLCDSLTSVRLLSLSDCGLQDIPKEINRLIHLRWLNLRRSKLTNEDLKTICKLYNLQFLWLFRCEIKEIPSEIGNLIRLIHLDLSHNKLVKELPESLCNLRELESLNVSFCSTLNQLPRGIHRLKKLKHLYSEGTPSLVQYPQGIARLTSLVTLNKVLPCDGSKLGWLENLNQLSGSLKLRIEISSSGDSVVKDARKAGMKDKMHIQKLEILFSDPTKIGGEQVKESPSVWKDVLDALEPHRNLQELEIKDYWGSRLPRWTDAPLNKQLRSIYLYDCEYLSSLPPLCKLPLLEEVFIKGNSRLKSVGREFLGLISTPSSSSRSMVGANTRTTNGFLKLQKLTFWSCSKWDKWEDITSYEEQSAGVSIMPCLTELTILDCNGLTVLPHRLLQKVSSSLKVLNVSGSELVDALEPLPNLHGLTIELYNGLQLPGWIESPLNQLGSIRLCHCKSLSSLPPLGILPLLESLYIYDLPELEYVGREFLGIAATTTSSSSSSSVEGTTTTIGGFLKLRRLEFNGCLKWKEWEDISTADEEEKSKDAVSSIMPCLTELTIRNCKGLTVLPHRLLRKVSSSLKVLYISDSTQLIQVYGDKEGQPWKSISRHNPSLRLKLQDV